MPVLSLKKHIMHLRERDQNTIYNWLCHS